MSGAGLLARDVDGRAARTGSRLRSGVLLAVGLVAAGLVLGTAPVPDAALDPRSTGPGGLQGALDVLRELDVAVELATADRPDATTVLVLPGVAPDRVAALAAPGRRLVSTVPPPAALGSVQLGVDGLGAVRLDADCALLPDVRRLESAGWLGWDLEDPAGIGACVAVGDGWWLARSQPPAGGEHLHLATLLPLVNARLGTLDTAVAAARLLAPGGRDDRVLVLLPDEADGASGGLGALLDPRVVQAALLLLGAAGLLAAARGRRLGAPPDERLPVRIPGGELVRALGDLRARAGHRDASLAALRARTVEELRRVHRLPHDAEVDELLAAHEHAGLAAPPGARAALSGAPVHDDDALLAAARALTALRVAIGTAARPAAASPAPTQTTTPDDTRTTS